MSDSIIIGEIGRNRSVYSALLNGTSVPETLYRPAPGKWNMLEIVCHLLDEERLDFRARMKHIIEDPENEMEPIDPQGWVISHRYSEMDFATVVEEFLTERNKSVAWLGSLSEEDLGKEILHKVFGVVTVRHFLHNWLAHDYLHIRQIAALKYFYLKYNTATDLRYAGDW